MGLNRINKPITTWCLTDLQEEELISYFKMNYPTSLPIILGSLKEGKKLKELTYVQGDNKPQSCVSRTTVQHQLRQFSLKAFGKKISLEGLRFTYIIDMIKKGYSLDYIFQKTKSSHLKVSQQRYRKIDKTLRLMVLKKYNSKCANCASMSSLQIDHIYPISKGGKTELSNLQILCSSCNLKKSNKVWEGFE